ncbi:MAG TPA: DUF6072 family protein, partial [Vicinamibacterales bacterium]
RTRRSRRRRKTVVAKQKEGRDMATTHPTVPETPAPGKILVNSAQAIGDALVPGASQFVAGNIKSGTLHLLAGIAAKAVLGPVGWLVAGADAYSESVTGKHLWNHFFTVEKSKD